MIILLFILLISILEYSSAFLGVSILSKLYENVKISSTKQCLVEDFMLRDWGLFDEAKLSFGSKPSFMVVTGETGAGKSVLIGGLEYVCKGDGIRRQLFTKESKSGEVLLTFNNKNNPSAEYKRIYSPSSRRTVCEVDGQRSSARIIANQLERSVRFWSSRDIDLLRPGAAGYYVDNLLPTEYISIKERIRNSYDEWLTSHQDVVRLSDLERRMEEGNDMELLSFYINEVSDMRDHAIDVLGRLHVLVLDLVESGMLDKINTDPSRREDSNIGDWLKSDDYNFDNGKEDNGGINNDDDNIADLDNDNSDSYDNPLSILATQLAIALEATNSNSNFDLTTMWETLVTADETLSALSAALCQPPATLITSPSNTNSIDSSSMMEMDQDHNEDHNQDQHQSTSDLYLSSLGMDMGLTIGNGKSKASPDKRVYALLKSLEGLVDDVSKMQGDLGSMDLGDSRLGTVLEDVQCSIQEASDALDAAADNLQAAQTSVPSLTQPLTALMTLMDRWAKIAGKHGVRPEGLQTLYQEWKLDMKDMTSIFTALPEARSRQARSMSDYCSLAARLTDARIVAAGTLEKAVNKVLPELNMADKKVDIIVKSLEVVSSIVEADEGIAPWDDLRPGVGLVSSSGWDEVHLIPSSSSSSSSMTQKQRKQEQEQEQQKPTYRDTENYIHKETNIDDYDSINANIEQLSTASLSSGEAARLALALEAASLEPSFLDRLEGRINCEIETAQTLVTDKKDTEFQKPKDKIEVSPLPQPLVVYDEIDAHIGGEAAAAVARLLKFIGRHRQVLAITHSPVIAAAADRHFVVEKGSGSLTVATDASLSSSKTTTTTVTTTTTTTTTDNHVIGTYDGKIRSRVQEVVGCGAAREAEIARMATGRLRTDAGTVLAKKLLRLNYGIFVDNDDDDDDDHDDHDIDNNDYGR